MQYLAVLGRQPEISLAELEALFGGVRQISGGLAVFSCERDFGEGEERQFLQRLGGSLKIAKMVDGAILEFLSALPEGKLTIGVSDYASGASARKAQGEALKLKKILARHGRSVRVVENKSAVLSSATSLHNGLAGNNPRKVELILNGGVWWKVVWAQDIEAYARRDQARPARDAKVGMLPPKLAQILINLCGNLPAGARILDPFCGTGVVLQEALLMGYEAYGTDIEPRMVEYSEKNLRWLECDKTELFLLSTGDATDFRWTGRVDAVACEAFLGQPMSLPPAEIKLKGEMQRCSGIILGFLRNLGEQIDSETPVVVAMPAWLRPDGSYSRMKIVDEICGLGYNVSNKSRAGLLYCRPGQVVARDIIILRKK